MTAFYDRIENLAPENRELLELFLKKEGLDPSALADYAAPTNDIEQKLAAIWSEVLGVERVGIHDNYFELGGDSILIIHIVTKAAQEGLTIHTQQLFDHPTVAALAMVTVHAKPGSEEAALHDREPKSSQPQPFSLAGIPSEQLKELLTKLPTAENAYPLTPMQEGILFHCLQAPSSEAYMVQWSARFRGNFDEAAFHNAWQTVVNRHAILRTAFHWIGLDRPLQIVHGDVMTGIDHQDWRSRSESEQKQALLALLETDRQKDFDLASAPLARITVVRLADDTYHCIWTHQHLILDGWSQQIILEEVFSHYRSTREGSQPSFRPTEPMEKHIAWLEKQDWLEHEVYWREYLKGFGAPTPVQKGVREEPTSDAPGVYNSQSLQCSKETTAKVQQYCREQKLTLNVLVQGAWSLVLGHLSGQEEVIFGATLSGRASRPQAAMVVGPMLNTLPVRATLIPESPLRAWLKGMQQRQSEQFRFEHTPLSFIRRWSELQDNRPLFESISVFENFQEKVTQLDGRDPLIIDEVSVVVREHYPLILVTTPGERLHFEIKSDGHRLPPFQIQCLISSMENVLELAVQHPGMTLGEIQGALAKADHEHQQQRQEQRRAANMVRLKSAKRIATPVTAK